MRSAETLGVSLRIKIKNLIDECGSIDLRDIEQSDGLKSLILSKDPILKINLISDSAFEISAPSLIICQSILRDYYCGDKRLKKQLASTETLIRQKSHAWALVSAYYFSFFSIIDALRICGTHLMSLSEKEARQLFIPIGGQHVAGLIKKRNFKGTVSSDFTKIGYVTNGDKPHQFAWKAMEENVFRILSQKSLAWPEIPRMKSICQGKIGWESPSEIRNRWNYRDSSYFSEFGENNSDIFFELMNSSERASRWIQTKSRINSERESAALVAVIYQLMKGAMNDLYIHGFLNSINIDKS